ncbi:MAG: hypothetical protein OIF55_08160 [Amphritea sp.]|nr:hypothetical protein [Amphritea sp.]
MEISVASASAWQQAVQQQDVSTAVAAKLKDSQELQGEMALQLLASALNDGALLEGATRVRVDSGAPLGQTIDVHV